MESDQVVLTKPNKLNWIVTVPKKCQAWLIPESQARKDEDGYTVGGANIDYCTERVFSVYYMKFQ